MDAVRRWTPQQVSSWMRGLDDALQPFVSSFRLQEVSGERLLSLTHTELLSLGMSRVGHQELLLEALDLLCALDGGLEKQQMQTLAAQMFQAHQNLSAAVSRRRKNPSYQNKSSNLPPNDFLSAVVELIAAAKALLAALDRTPGNSCRAPGNSCRAPGNSCRAPGNSCRAPGNSCMDLSSTKSRIIQLCLELTSTVQKDCTVFEMEEKILEVSKSLNGICEQAAQLTPDPCTLEEVTISGIKPGQGLGIYIKSTYDGLHVITGTTENSPADRTQRIHAGDELVQVDGQTVVGWQLKRLVERLRSDSGSVVLTLKKRPAGNVSAAPLRNMRWRPPLVKTHQPCAPRPGPEPEGAAILDLYIPPPPAAPCCPLEGGSSSVKALDSTRPFSCSDPDPPVTPATPDDPRPLSPVRLRQRPSTRSKVRPVSMPAELSRVHPRKGLQRCSSNERVSAILEEGCFPVQYRAQPPGRGVDHIRGSQCFIGSELHHSATMCYQETRAGSGPESGPGSRPESGPGSSPGSRRKAGSVLGGWLSRLRLMSH